MSDKKRLRAGKSKNPILFENLREYQILKDQLKLKKFTSWMLKKIIYSSQQRSHRTDRKGKTNDTFTRRFLVAHDPIVIFSEEIQENSIVKFKSDKLNKNKKLNNINQKENYAALHNLNHINNILSENSHIKTPFVLTHSFSHFRKPLKSPFSDVFVPAYDLLPSPAMFSSRSSASSETNRFLQELALYKIENFLRNFENDIELNFTAKSCMRCNLDFSTFFKCIDSTKNIFLCEKCVTRKRRSDWSKINLLSALNKNFESNDDSKTNSISTNYNSLVNPLLVDNKSLSSNFYVSPPIINPRMQRIQIPSSLPFNRLTARVNIPNSTYPNINPINANFIKPGLMNNVLRSQISSTIHYRPADSRYISQPRFIQTPGQNFTIIPRSQVNLARTNVRTSNHTSGNNLFRPNK